MPITGSSSGPAANARWPLAMINVIIAEELYDHEFVEKYGFGFDRLAGHVRPFTPEWAEPITRVKRRLDPRRREDIWHYEARVHPVG